MPGKQDRRRSIIVASTSILTLLCIVGCGAPRQVSHDDERLKPMWEAIARVDRESLGFTPISPDAEIFLEGKQFGGDDYDAMLHIEGESSRTIGFRKSRDGFIWLGEQEIFEGPNEFETVDGRVRESISLSYEISHLSGVPLDSLDIFYFGEDSIGYHLTLVEVQPVIEKWTEHARLHPRQRSLFEKLLMRLPWW